MLLSLRFLSKFSQDGAQAQKHIVILYTKYVFRRFMPVTVITRKCNEQSI